MYFIEKTEFQFSNIKFNTLCPLPMKKSLAVYGVLRAASAGLPSQCPLECVAGAVLATLVGHLRGEEKSFKN